MRRILITGGAGFIGSSIAKRLSHTNSELIILDDFSVGRKENLTFQCDVIEGNIVDEKWMNKVHDIDYILHFAAPSSVVLFQKNLNKCLIDTIVGLANVFEFAAKFKAKKVIFPSSSSVYGNTPLPQCETTSTLPANPYGVAKLACEHIARLYSHVVPSVGLRIFAGYGPGEAHKGEIASIITIFIKDIARNHRPIIFGDGTQSRDFVYIDDIVEAALAAIDNDFTGIINVGSGQSRTFNEIVAIINNLLCKNIRPRYIEKPAQYFEHTLADITKMKDVLNISPTSLEVGLKKCLELKGDILKG
jgi:nucleoside-diphosphate-sugar epimerase